jgi:hypothetical protein
VNLFDEIAAQVVFQRNHRWLASTINIQAPEKLQFAIIGFGRMSLNRAKHL